MFADLTDVRCYYELQGSGDPVLLIAGLGATCSLWDGVAGDLSNSFCLILFDNRGMGRSRMKRPPHMLADFAVDIVELLDHLQLERVHVIGLSLGGIIAQQLAVDHPSRIDRLVLVSCSHRFGPYLRDIAKLLGQAMRYFPPELYRRIVELFTTAPEYFDEHVAEIDRKLVEECAQGISRRAIARQLRCLARSEATLDDQDYRITAPTLVVAGDRDMLIPSCYARRMADQIPGSEFMLIRECGHNPFIEQPEVVAPRITEFLMHGRRDHDRRRHEDAKPAMEEMV
jgi:3-oxoadipate enol-lactonase